MNTRTAWLGLAALGVLQYLGPRPLFVRTAYADAPACEVAMQGTGVDDSGLLLAVETDGSAPAWMGGCER